MRRLGVVLSLFLALMVGLGGVVWHCLSGLVSGSRYLPALSGRKKLSGAAELHLLKCRHDCNRVPGLQPLQNLERNGDQKYPFKLRLLGRGKLRNFFSDKMEDEMYQMRSSSGEAHY